MEPNPSDWCKFDAVDKTSFLIISCVMVAQSVMFCLFLRSLTIRVHHGINISRDEGFLFKVISLWFVIAFLKSALNVFVYAIYETNEDYHNDEGQIVLSAICLFLDKMSSFCLHTVLLKIPCLWIKNTVMRLDGEDLTLQESRRVDRVFRILSFLNFYLKARIIILFINIAFDIWMIIDPDIGHYAKYLTVLTMFEAVVACFTYTFGIISLNKFKNLLDFPKELEKRVLIQYTLLMFCSIARLIFNVLYYFHFTTKKYQPTYNCFDSETGSYMGYVYLSLGYTIMHILPITTIILIYWPQIEQPKKTSLIQDVVQDMRLLKKKITLSNNCYLLGSGQIPIHSLSTISQVQQEKTKKPEHFRVYYDK